MQRAPCWMTTTRSRAVGTVTVGILGVALVVAALAGQVKTSQAAAGPFWVNDLEYGSIGGGFHWDPVSGQVWTAERTWHPFSPQPPRPSPQPLWVNDLAYGSAGGGFYWDPLSGEVWTAERRWHSFRPGPPTPTPTPRTSPSPTPTATTIPPINVAFQFGAELDERQYRVGDIAELCYEMRPHNVPFTVRIVQTAPFNQVRAEFRDDGRNGRDCVRLNINRSDVPRIALTVVARIDGTDIQFSIPLSASVTR